MTGGAPIEQIGRYRILSELGKGAMGIVYRAEDPNIGRVVALKTTRVDLQGPHNEEILRRFRQEARSAGVLNHPNIVTIYDAGEHEGLFYMAMEFVQGHTLESLLDAQGILPTERVLDIGRQICAGLDYAHAHDVVHRDIKPANIMITPEGTVKIMDFGIAKTGAGMTTAGQVLGTPSYMSPEQVKGLQLDGRSDLFSVGVILYEAVTGVKPFVADNITAIVYKIVHEELQPPSKVEVELHPGLDSVITRALAKSPAERYQTGAELARDLLNYESLPVSASIPATSPDAETIAMQPLPSGLATGALAARATGTSRRPVAEAPSVAAAKPAAPAKTSSAMMAALVGVLLLLLVASGAIFWWARHKRNQIQAASTPPATQTAAVTPPVTPPVAAPATPAETTPGTEAALASATPSSSAAAPSSEPPAASSESGSAAAVPLVTKPAKSEKAVRAKTPKTAPAPTTTQSQNAPATGDLKVSATPEGVKVEVDGQQWNAPYTIAKLSPGPHRVIFSKPGYNSETKTAQVVAGQTAEVSAVLSAAPSTLSINSTPVGAEIVLDGKPTGKVTPADFPVPHGAHSIQLKKTGFQPAETTVNMQPGQNNSFSPTLVAVAKPGNIFKRIFGGDPNGRESLDIRTTPKGAEVLIDGAALPKKTPTRAPLQPGTYQVTIRMDGYKTVEKTVEVKKGVPAQIEETLEKQ